MRELVAVQALQSVWLARAVRDGCAFVTASARADPNDSMCVEEAD